MLFDSSNAPSGPVYLLRLEQGPLAVSGARPFWIISESGLTIGRAPDCNISLSDEARIISRVQARVALVQGRVVWQQLGANPTWVNAVPLEKGSEKTLRVNDVIRLDPYVFQVALRSTSKEAGVSSSTPIPVIPEDWNPMAMPDAPVDHSQVLAQFSGDPVGSQLNRILNSPDVDIPHVSSESEEGLAANASPIDELFRSDTPFLSGPKGYAADAPVWMDELHARHGFSISTGGAAERSTQSEPKQPVANPVKQLASNEDFQNRFLEGLGLKSWIFNQAQHVSPNFAFEMGQTYRKALDGLISMMSARALLKNQIHAEHTTLVPRDNNPLKSCPSVDDLFLRWFASADHSYLKPTGSIEASILDLLEQQRVTALALKTVISRLAESFDPEVLLASTEASAGSWEFRKYKARWEAYIEAYHSVFGHAADPVSAVLSDAFRQAFETQSQGAKS